MDTPRTPISPTAGPVTCRKFSFEICHAMLTQRLPTTALGHLPDVTADEDVEHRSHLTETCLSILRLRSCLCASGFFSWALWIPKWQDSLVYSFLGSPFPVGSLLPRVRDQSTPCICAACIHAMSYYFKWLVMEANGKIARCGKLHYTQNFNSSRNSFSSRSEVVKQSGIWPF